MKKIYYLFALFSELLLLLYLHLVEFLPSNPIVACGPARQGNSQNLAKISMIWVITARAHSAPKLGYISLDLHQTMERYDALA